jgi:sec-independent protein translocase protein TatA
VNSFVPALAFLNAWEIVLILAVVVLFFGVKKLPGLARGFGQGIKEFKTAVREEESDKTEVETKK